MAKLDDGFDVMISIHAPMRGRPGKHGRPREPGNFNPRPHAGATGNRWTSAGMTANFNPRPHAGATAPAGSGAPAGRISIHAPMRGRPHDMRQKEAAQYFNPRPHAGATRLPWRLTDRLPDFNPRPHAGATFLQEGPFKAITISIHAPMRGRQNEARIAGKWR